MAKNVKNVFVTGYKGFIGHHLCVYLQKNGYHIRGCDLSEKKDAADIKNLEKADVMVNLAAHLNPPKYNTVKVAKAVAKFCQSRNIPLVHTSSAAVYQPIDNYGKHKHQSELEIQKEKDGGYCILRLFNVFGKNGSGVIDRFIKSYKSDRTLCVHGDGEQKRDYISVLDVCSAIEMGFYTEGVYDVGAGVEYSVQEIADKFPPNKELEYIDESPGIRESCACNFLPGWQPEKTNIDNYLYERL